MKDSLNKKYISKLSSSLISFFLGFITLGIIPKELGPESYGNFSFLTNFFQRILKFLKFGLPSSYLTKLSKRNKEKNIIGFYQYILFITIFIIFSVTFLALCLGFQEVLWPKQESIFIFYALLFTMFSYMLSFFRITMDALGFTVIFEKAVILQSILLTLLILIFYFINLINLQTYFLINFIIMSFLIFSSLLILRKNRIFLSQYLSLSKKEFLNYIKEFYSFSHPLFFNGLVVFFVSLADRWLLQFHSGSIEQGYFGFSLKIVSITFIFTAAMSTLFQREMSLSYQNKDLKNTRLLFKKNVLLFFLITSYFAVFISTNADKISFFIAQDLYKDANMTIAIMAFYPVHQAYGQLSGSVFLAMEKTYILRNIGMLTGITGFFFSVLFISSNWMGLGATGLAIKMVLIQFISVNIGLFINIKNLKLSLWKYFGHQFAVLFAMFVFISLSTYVTDYITQNTFLSFIICGLLYTILVLLFVSQFPQFIGRNKSDLINYKTSINKFIKKYKG